MYLGHGAYGVEAASRLYFSKSNKQLTLEEAALIAGIFQTPERQSPFVDMKRATRAPQHRAAAHGRRALHHARRRPTPRKQKPIVTRGQPNQPPGIAPFFVEEVRKHLEQRVRREGAVRKRPRRCTTTLDAKLQELGEQGDRARPARATTSATAGGSRRAT